MAILLVQSIKPMKLISPDPYSESSLVNVGGGCFLLLARINNQINKFKMFYSVDIGFTWTPFSGMTDFNYDEPQGSWAAPPWLSFINYEGVGIVACYYTIRINQPPTYPDSLLKVIFGIAKDLLENGVSAWNKYSIFEWSEKQGSLHIGLTFQEPNTSYAYPVIIFTNISGMKDVLLALGL
jgi:hypothetical protein